MNARQRPVPALALLLPLLLTGCSLLPSTRKLPTPKAPAITQTVTPEELIAHLNESWKTLNTLNLGVDVQASVVKTKEGTATDEPSFPALIYMAKPENLRVFGRVPIIHTELFDMVSDGKEFTLFVPICSKVFKGSDAVETKRVPSPDSTTPAATASSSACSSAKTAQNLRPGFLLDALAVKGLDPADEYYVTADTFTVPDAARKHLLIVPEYMLNVVRRKPGSHRLTPLRVITFHREDLEPYEQDIYDSEGNLETQVTYGPYKDFDSTRYPSTITIKRPLDEFQIVITVDGVKQNQPLSEDPLQDPFQITNIPPDTPVQKIE
jgi:hypothetical protein